MSKPTPAEAKRIKNFHQEKIDKLYNKNIAEHILKIEKMRDDAYSYFYWASPLWKAICDSIENNRNCPLIDREGVIVKHSSGTGIRFISAAIYGWKVEEIKDIHIKLKVEYFRDENRDYDTCSTYIKEYEIAVPIELYNDFSRNSFDKWISGLQDVKDAETKKEEVQELKRLMKKYPVEAKKEKVQK